MGPSYVFRSGTGTFAEAKKDSLVLVRHSDEGVLSAKYGIQPLTGRCVFSDVAIALAKADGDRTLPPRVGDNPAATMQWCEEQCSRNLLGMVPDTHFSLEGLQ